VNPAANDAALTNHVVWVDEQPRLQRAFTTFFEGHEIDATIVSNGIEAIEAVREQHPKILVLHNLSFAIENYAVCAGVRSTLALARTFVLVGTGPYVEDDMTDLLRSGADLTIDRPIDPDVLLDIVDNVFENRLTTRPRTCGTKRKIRFLED